MNHTRTHKIIGATVRAANRTYGLLPPQDYGPEETVAEVLNAHSLLIRTVEGNVYSNGNFLLIRYAAEPIEDNDDEVQRRLDAHEMFLASEGADHLFEGRGE